MAKYAECVPKMHSGKLEARSPPNQLRRTQCFLPSVLRALSRLEEGLRHGVHTLHLRAY